MAEGLFRRAAGDRYEVFSAGTKPSLVRPEAITVMREIGIDISGQRSKSVDEFAGKVGSGHHCLRQRQGILSGFPGATERLHWPFEDPAAVQAPRNSDSRRSGRSGTKSGSECNGSSAFEPRQNPQSVDAFDGQQVLRRKVLRAQAVVLFGGGAIRVIGAITIWKRAPASAAPPTRRGDWLARCRNRTSAVRTSALWGGAFRVPSCRPPGG